MSLPDYGCSLFWESSSKFSCLALPPHIRAVFVLGTWYPPMWVFGRIKQDSGCTVRLHIAAGTEYALGVCFLPSSSACLPPQLPAIPCSPYFRILGFCKQSLVLDLLTCSAKLIQLWSTSPSHCCSAVQ